MLQEADGGLTEMAMQGAQGRYAADKTLLVKFYKHPKKNNTRSVAEGRPIFEDLDYIEIMTPGNKDSIVQRPATQMDKNRFAEHYQRYQARQDDDEYVDGTRLEEWPGITRGQCEELKFFNVQTVEQLATLADVNAQNIMGIQSLKAKAQAYLEDADSNALKQALAAQQEENARLQAQISELAEKMASDAPKKRGRPPKEE
jgi:uncharacterized coiled-coil protein SlyX